MKALEFVGLINGVLGTITPLQRSQLKVYLQKGLHINSLVVLGMKMFTD